MVLSLLSFNLQAKHKHKSRNEEKEVIIKDPPSSKQETRLSEIKYFKDLPKGNYTIGYGFDSTGRKIIPLAVYDKTFPNLMDKKQLLKIFLASIGVGDLNLNTLVEKIRKKRTKKKSKILEEHFLKELFDKEPDDDKKLYFEKDWWKNPNIRWKNKCRNILKDEPSRIPLSCISVRKTSVKDKIAHKVQTFLSNSLFEKDVWDGMQELTYFQKQENGTYELIVTKESKIAPTKIIDLRGYNSSYRKAVSWTIQTNIIKVAIGQIPFAVVPQIIVSILERFFNYIEVVYMFQQGEAMSMIVEAKHNNPGSPFYGVLSQKELDHSIQYLERASVFFSSILKNLFATKEKTSRRFLEKREKKREKNLKYLQRKDFSVTELGQSYALCVKKDSDDKFEKLRVYSLIKRKTMRRKPHAVVDFLNPYREYFKRNLLETILVASNFAFTAIPIIPTLVRVAFKEIAIREMQRYQMHEAGFRSYLDYFKGQIRDTLIAEGASEVEADDYIESAYKIIKLRSLNPLVLTQKGRKKRKLASELWITERYPDYVPI